MSIYVLYLSVCLSSVSFCLFIYCIYLSFIHPHWITVVYLIVYASFSFPSWSILSPFSTTGILTHLFIARNSPSPPPNLLLKFNSYVKVSPSVLFIYGALYRIGFSVKFPFLLVKEVEQWPLQVSGASYYKTCYSVSKYIQATSLSSHCVCFWFTFPVQPAACHIVVAHS